MDQVNLSFFFQAEDGIRDATVTGVQTCALPISDDRIVNSRKFERDLSTRTPCCVTAAGRRGAARDSRFCTSTCARSGFVPGSNDSVIEPLPLACDTD